MEQKTLTNIYNTLGRIEVHGRDNLARLLGCMQELEKLIAQVDAPKKEECT